MQPRTILFLSFSAMLLNGKLYAQKPLRDSLRTVIQNSKPDSNQVNALYDLAFTYVNTAPDSAILYGMQSMELSTNLNYQKGIANADYVLGAGSFRKGDLKKA